MRRQWPRHFLRDFPPRKSAGCTNASQDFPPRKCSIRPTPDWLTPDSLPSPQIVYGRAYADVTTKISRMHVDLPTSGLKFFSRARSGSGRFFNLFCGESEERSGAGANYRNRRWEAKDFKKVWDGWFTKFSWLWDSARACASRARVALL